jgi:hypothetical protein
MTPTLFSKPDLSSLPPRSTRQQARLLADNLLLEATVTANKSIMLPTFGRAFSKLPNDIKNACHEKYHKWRKNPLLLNFEYKFRDIYAVELPRGYRAIAIVKQGVSVEWLWVGDHRDYDYALSGMRKK